MDIIACYYYWVNLLLLQRTSNSHLSLIAQNLINNYHIFNIPLFRNFFPSPSVELNRKQRNCGRFRFLPHVSRDWIQTQGSNQIRFFSVLTATSIKQIGNVFKRSQSRWARVIYANVMTDYSCPCCVWVFLELMPRVDWLISLYCRGTIIYLFTWIGRVIPMNSKKQIPL